MPVASGSLPFGALELVGWPVQEWGSSARGPSRKTALARHGCYGLRGGRGSQVMRWSE